MKTHRTYNPADNSLPAVHTAPADTPADAAVGANYPSTFPASPCS